MTKLQAKKRRDMEKLKKISVKSKLIKKEDVVKAKKKVVQAKSGKTYKYN